MFDDLFDTDSDTDSDEINNEFDDYVNIFYRMNENIIHTCEDVKESIDVLIKQLQETNNAPNKKANNTTLSLIDNFYKKAKINQNSEQIDELIIELQNINTLGTKFEQAYLKKKGTGPLPEIEKPSKIARRDKLSKSKQLQLSPVFHMESQKDNKSQEEMEQILLTIEQKISAKKEEERKLKKYLKDLHSDYNNIKDVYKVLENTKKDIQKDDDEQRISQKNIINKDENNIISNMNDQQKLTYFNKLIEDTNYNISIYDFANLTSHITSVNEKQFRYMIDLFKNKKSKNQEGYQIIFRYLTDLTMPMFEEICNLEGFLMEYLSSELLLKFANYVKYHNKLFEETEELLKLNEKILNSESSSTNEDKNKRKNHLLRAKRKYYKLQNQIHGKIEIYDGTTVIEPNLFNGFVFDTLCIPNCVEKIGDNSFYFCQKLTEVDLKCFNLKEIGKSAFSGCISLKFIKLPENITVINEYTFKECKSLKEITFSSQLEEIKDEAFAECNSLTKIKLPRIKKIGVGAFKKCESLKFFKIPGILIIHPNEENDNDNKIKEEKDEKVNNNNNNFCISAKCFYKCSQIKNVIIMSGCQKIDEFAFAACPEIVSFEMNLIQNSTIEKAAFQNCKNIEKVNFKVTNNSSLTIGEKSFENCAELKEINFDKPDLFEPKQVKFGNFAFSGCESLSTFKFPPKSDGNIGEYCFNCCKKLKNVDLPELMTEISSGLFKKCQKLSKIKLNNEITIIHSNSFEDCQQLILESIPPKLTKIESEAFKNCISLFIENLQKRSDENDQVLNVLSFPVHLQIIEKSAFENCSNIDIIIIHEKMEKIQKNAFRGCGKLQKVTNYSKNLELEKKAFRSCLKLTSVETTGREKFSPEAFYECIQGIEIFTI